MTTVIEISKRHRNFGRHEYLFRDVFEGTDEECLKHIKQCAEKTIDDYYRIGFVLSYIAIYGKTTLHAMLTKGDVEDSWELDSYTEINLVVHVTRRRTTLL